MGKKKIRIRLVTRNPDDPTEILDSITVTVPAGKEVDVSLDEEIFEEQELEQKAETLEIESTEEIKEGLEENAIDHAGNEKGDEPNQLEKLRSYFNKLRDLGIQTVVKTGIDEIIKNL